MVAKIEVDDFMTLTQRIEKNVDALMALPEPQRTEKIVRMILSTAQHMVTEQADRIEELTMAVNSLNGRLEELEEKWRKE